MCKQNTTKTVKVLSEDLHLELPKNEKYHFALQFYCIFMETDQKKKSIVVYFSE